MRNETTTYKKKRLNEIIGIIAILSGLYLMLSFLTYNKWDSSLFTFTTSETKNYGGMAGAYISDIVFSFIGFSGYLIPLFLIIYGIRRIFGKDKNMLHVFGALLIMPSLSMFFQLLSKSIQLNIDPPGGLVGLLMSGFFERFLSSIGAYIVNIMMLLVSMTLLSPVSIFSYLLNIRFKKKVKNTKDNLSSTDYDSGITISESNKEIQIDTSQPKRLDPEKVLPKDSSGYRLPSLELLNPTENVSGPTKEELNAAATGLEKKLSDFGVTGKIKHAHPGPVVTMYEFEPAAGIKINKIVSLSDDLALALRAPSIRVYPIAGKATIGIEVPNANRAIVSLREIIASESFQKSTSLLTLALGKDIFGNPVIADLAKMPHLLVAGTTGSGKSVFMNSIIISLLYKTAPDEVKMLMIDPKLLELSTYNGIPHMISPVITSPKEAADALKKIVYEMERRYRLLADTGARNIYNYNKQVSNSERLPYIVVFIDELADLMFTAPKDVENSITRLAQMARASGIHLILATQRPSVDVITGLIKANFPARISFQVATKIDSRTILDAQGAEQLLGMGDMLFMIPGAKIIRIHGAYVSDSEVNLVTEFVKSQQSPDYTSFNSILLPDEKISETDRVDEKDEMYQKVIDFAASVGEISISSIQRRFKIGYNKAANIMELLEKDGLVGPPKGAGKPRVFIGRRQ